MVNIEEAIKLLDFNLSEATDDSLKKQYRKMVLRHHPDKGGNNDKFLRIKEAYDIVKKYLRDRSISQYSGQFIFVDNQNYSTTANFSWTYRYG
jgi:curved DNA-binding protein CbpA